MNDHGENDQGTDAPRDPVKITIIVCGIAVTLVVIAYLVVTSPLCEVFHPGSYYEQLGKCAYIPMRDDPR